MLAVITALPHSGPSHAIARQRCGRCHALPKTRSIPFRLTWIKQKALADA